MGPAVPQGFKRRARRGVARYPMHGAAGEGGRAAEKQTVDGSLVRRHAGQRAEHRLQAAVAAATDVTCDQVRIASLEVCGPEHVASEDPAAKAGREALDLLLDGLYVTVGGELERAARGPMRV